MQECISQLFRKFALYKNTAISNRALSKGKQIQSSKEFSMDTTTNTKNEKKVK